jgi:hypothetical protein
MNLQSGLRLLAISVAAICWGGQANAQTVTLEASGTVDALHGGGWGAFGGNSNLGQAVTLDFAYNSGAITETLNNNFLVESAPLTSASIVSGAFGSGINLESNGKGSITDQFNLTDGTFTSTSATSGHAPSKGFTGEVFGFSFVTNGVNTTLDVIRNTFFDGIRDARDSGTAILSNVSIGQVTGTQAPEIDPASALSALTLLAGGLAVIRGRKFVPAQKA